MSGPPTKFTPEQDAAIRSGAARGHSQQEVAALLGMTKNRVVGRAHRLKIAFGGSARFDPATPQVEPLVQVNKNGCAFIAGDPRHFRAKGEEIFCGKRRRPGSSYCPDHHARCWTPMKPRRGGEAVGKETGKVFR